MRYIRQIEKLLLVSEMLATNSGQKEILTEILNLLEKHLSYLRGTILLLSKDGSVLTIEAVNATSTVVDKDILYMRGEGIVGQV